MTVEQLVVAQPLLLHNDQIAARNREYLDAAGVLLVNIIAGPGAGKTSLISATLRALAGKARIGVIEGDIAGTIDTEKVQAAGAAAAVQINTGGNCHLDAKMIDGVLPHFDLDGLDLLFVENVGNLVCPTHWGLGEHRRVCVLGASEGHDKPIKYPEIFTVSDAIVLNKTDLIDLVDFERDAFVESVRALNDRAPIFELSCRTGTGIEAWASWLLKQRLAVGAAHHRRLPVTS